MELGAGLGLNVHDDMNGLKIGPSQSAHNADVTGVRCVLCNIPFKVDSNIALLSNIQLKQPVGWHHWGMKAVIPNQMTSAQQAVWERWMPRANPSGIGGCTWKIYDDEKKVSTFGQLQRARHELHQLRPFSTNPKERLEIEAAQKKEYFEIRDTAETDELKANNEQENGASACLTATVAVVCAVAIAIGLGCRFSNYCSI